ncbi:MAG TPA: amidinotransferase [Yinghuangia sp.]|uniref:dimethylarginine dimethylaminohydrolase family protein n=1 Tax=Yinghuangia sp. YIM S10712 TaxID=3436930 RepID=UPI002BF263DF|nr:amidinotransferase [Yinghuangia sp.]
MRLIFSPSTAGAGTLSPSASSRSSRRARLPRPRPRREAVGRQASRRVYVMCPPTHHSGGAADTPHAGGADDPAAEGTTPLRAAASAPNQPAAEDGSATRAKLTARGAAVDADSPMDQWERLREVLLRLGHTVSLIPPRGGLPGMVFAAHAATVVNGRVLGARYRSMARQPETPAYLRWFADRGYPTRLEPVFAHEGETDLIPTGSHLLAACGPHTEARAHAEAGEFLGLPVVPLELTHPRITRLGSAMTVLTDQTIAYHPAAFSAGARERLARLFPERIPVGEEDTLAGGLDAICDGRTVVLTDRAPGLAAQLARHGFRTVALDMSRFAGFGVGVRSCVLELRDNR